MSAMEIVRIGDWALRIQDPRKVIANHTSLVVAEIVFTFACLLTFLHAFRYRGRYLITWFGVFALGLILENIRFLNPQMDIFFHSPGILTLFGMRTPLYVVLGMYHMLLYIAYVMARKLRLPWWAQGPACGLLLLLIDFPVHFMGVKLLWWQWHDSEANFLDRSYSVPWVLYSFDAFIGSSFIWTLHALRWLFLSSKYDWMLWMREMICAISAGAIALVIAALQLNIFVLVPHYLLKIHTSVPVLISIALYAIVVIIADRNNLDEDARSFRKQFWFDELACAICIHYIFFMSLPVVADPQNIVSEGLHQPIWSCNVIEEKSFFNNLVLTRQKYLCPTNYNADYFDFHCNPYQNALDRITEIPLEWYAICGLDFTNRMEYIFIIWSFSFISLVIFYQILASSGPLPLEPVKVYIRRKLEERPVYSEHHSDIMSSSIERQHSSDLEELFDSDRESTDLSQASETGEQKKNLMDNLDQMLCARSRDKSKKKDIRGKKKEKSSHLPTLVNELRTRNSRRKQQPLDT